jgi:hypothetical protein
MFKYLWKAFFLQPGDFLFDFHSMMQPAKIYEVLT